VTLEVSIQGRPTSLSGQGRYADGKLDIEVHDPAGDFTLSLTESQWDGEIIESGGQLVIRLHAPQ